MKKKVQKINNHLPVKNSLGEGLFIFNNMIAWVDIDRFELNLYQQNNHLKRKLPIQATTVLDIDNDSLTLSSLNNDCFEIGRFNIFTNEYETMISHKYLVDNSYLFRTNDAVMLDRERFLIGTMVKNKTIDQPGDLIYLDSSSAILIDKNFIPNSFILLDSGEILISDSFEKIVWKYRFLDFSEGRFEKEIFHKFDEYVPDGGCLIDQKIYITIYNKSLICVFDLCGNIINELLIPLTHPTNCKYDKNNKSLWITSAMPSSNPNEMDGNIISVSL